MATLGRVLFMDLETRSRVDLRATGVYVYADDPSTDVTVARLAIGMEEPVEWRPGRELPARFVAAMADPMIDVVAHNAQFERILIERVLHPRYGWPLIPIDRWTCTMARARMLALPGSLDGAGAALGLGVKKDGVGYRLMLQMCRPRSIDPATGAAVWWQDDDRMARLSDYCSTDVKVERAVYRSTPGVPPDELDVYDLTETINDRGVRFDLDFVYAARHVAEETRDLLDADMIRATRGAVTRASNIGGLKTWLLRRGVDLSPPPELVRDPIAGIIDGELKADPDTGVEVEDEAEIEEEEKPAPELRRRDVLRLIADPRVGETERVALRTRLEAGKISVKKLEAILDRASADGRVRGLLGYHGANTGRYISQGLQVQNFPRDVSANWDADRAMLDQGAAAVDAIVGPPLDVISKMLRGAIIPADGHDIATGDFSSVEAVGVAWLAGQADLLRAFRDERKIYEEMAGRVYGLDPKTITKDSVERHVGKTLVLGAGYQMGWWKFRETCLVQAGILLTPGAAQRAIDVYRETYARIPELWRDMNEAAIGAVKHPGMITAVSGGRIRFRQDRKWLRMRLPSGRYLWYSQPLVEKNKYNSDCVTYMAVNNKTRKWERQGTYGGRLTENAVQGLCRDLLVTATLRLERAGYRPITLIHDEIVAEPETGFGSVEEMCALMSETPAWAHGFPLSTKGARGSRYAKA
jgi:DNA polymerase